MEVHNWEEIFRLPKFVLFVLHTMSSQRATTGISVIRKRNYSTHFSWTDELNRDLYDIYTVSKRQGPGYMQRLKNTWDETYPHLRHFSEKHLRQQATQYGKKLQRIAVFSHIALLAQ